MTVQVALSFRTLSGTKYTLWQDGTLLIRRSDTMGGTPYLWGTVPGDGVHDNVTFDGIAPNGGMMFSLENGKSIITTAIAQKTEPSLFAAV